MTEFTKSRILWAALLLFLAGPVIAVDGVIEIHQTAVGVGVPFQITEPGSYRLTSNLEVTDVNTSVIQITVNNVTIDLNGFTIFGVVDCPAPTGTVTACTSTGTGNGIETVGTLEGITIRNGRIRGMGDHGVSISAESYGAIMIADVQILSNGKGGILCSGCNITNSIVNINGGHGIEAPSASSGTLLTKSLIVGNKDFGLLNINFTSNTLRNNGAGQFSGGNNIGGAHNVCNGPTC